MSPNPPSPPSPPSPTTPAASPGEPELLASLAAFLTGPPARLLIVEGPPGAGKSSLLRALGGRLPEPQVRIAYRHGKPTPASELPGDTGSAGISIVLLDTRGVPVPETASTLASLPAADQPDPRTAAIAAPGTPEEILQAIGAMASLGRGCLFVDAWDRSSEAGAGTVGAASAFGRLLASAGELSERLAQVPVSTVSAVLAPAPPELKSMADGVVALRSLDWDGPPVRLLVVEKLSARTHLASHHLYTLDGGTFVAPSRLARGFVPPVVLPEPDPEPEAETLWPGSTAFADAFGRLDRQSLTGLEMVGSVGSVYGEALWTPIVASVVTGGGRVVVIPPVDVTPASLYARLRESAPGAELPNGLRILSAAGPAGSGGVPEKVLLPLPGHSAPIADRPLESVHALEPLLPDAVHFLEGASAGHVALYVAALDGLRAITAVTRRDLDARTFPLLASSLTRLRGFVGFGLGRTDDPLTAAMLPSLELHLRLELREGQLLLHAAQPAGPAFFLTWAIGEPRYRLLRAS